MIVISIGLAASRWSVLQHCGIGGGVLFLAGEFYSLSVGRLEVALSSIEADITE